MWYIRQLTFIYVFPCSAAVTGAEEMRVTEVSNCHKNQVDSELFSGIDSSDGVTGQDRTS